MVAEGVLERIASPRFRQKPSGSLLDSWSW